MIPVPAHPILPHPGSGPHPHRSPLRLGRGLRPHHSAHTPSAPSDSNNSPNYWPPIPESIPPITTSIESIPVLKPVHPEALQTIPVEDQIPPRKTLGFAIPRSFSPCLGFGIPSPSQAPDRFLAEDLSDPFTRESIWDSQSQGHPKLPESCLVGALGVYIDPKHPTDGTQAGGKHFKTGRTRVSKDNEFRSPID